MTRPQLFAARPWGRAEADCFGIRPPSARRLVAAAPISEKKIWIFMDIDTVMPSNIAASYLPQRHPLIGEACELNSTPILSRTIVAAGPRGLGFRAGATNGRVFNGGVVEVTMQAAIW
jgi:hypothetical protein